jgi:hypothetical protein
MTIDGCGRGRLFRIEVAVFFAPKVPCWSAQGNALGTWFSDRLHAESVRQTAGKAPWRRKSKGTENQRRRSSFPDDAGRDSRRAVGLGARAGRFGSVSSHWRDSPRRPAESRESPVVSWLARTRGAGCWGSPGMDMGGNLPLAITPTCGSAMRAHRLVVAVFGPIRVVRPFSSLGPHRSDSRHPEWMR